MDFFYFGNIARNGYVIDHIYSGMSLGSHDERLVSDIGQTVCWKADGSNKNDGY